MQPHYLHIMNTQPLTHSQPHTHTHTCTHIHAYTYTYRIEQTHPSTHTHTCLHTHPDVYIHANTHTYVHTHWPTHHMQRLKSGHVYLHYLCASGNSWSGRFPPQNAGRTSQGVSSVAGEKSKIQLQKKEISKEWLDGITYSQPLTAFNSNTTCKNSSTLCLNVHPHVHHPHIAFYHTINIHIHPSYLYKSASTSTHHISANLHPHPPSHSTTLHLSTSHFIAPHLPTSHSTALHLPTSHSTALHYPTSHSHPPTISLQLSVLVHKSDCEAEEEPSLPLDVVLLEEVGQESQRLPADEYRLVSQASSNVWDVTVNFSRVPVHRSKRKRQSIITSFPLIIYTTWVTPSAALLQHSRGQRHF